MARKRRDIPEDIAKLITDEQLEQLHDALEHFDGSYHELMDHLKDLGATSIIYMMANRGIKRTMGKGRGEVSLSDDDEMNVWGDGYTISKDKMHDLEDPEQVTSDSFIEEMKLNGWLPWD